MERDPSQLSVGVLACRTRFKTGCWRDFGQNSQDEVETHRGFGTASGSEPGSHLFADTDAEQIEAPLQDARCQVAQSQSIVANFFGGFLEDW